jgi:hypothetical protein
VHDETRKVRRVPVRLRVLLLACVLLGTGLASAASSDESARLASLPPAVAGNGGYAFLVTDSQGRPATFDPCSPVHWVLRPDGAAPGSEQVVHDAVAQVARSTGLQFVFDGHTDEAPADDRPQRQPERYGVGWAPVLVAWSTADVTPQLQGTNVGLGVASWTQDVRNRLVSGQVVLDAEDLTTADGATSPLTSAALLHELAHVVGLDHVEDADQLLHVVVGRSGFGDGDRRGLRAAGSGPCG